MLPLFLLIDVGFRLLRLLVQFGPGLLFLFRLLGRLYIAVCHLTFWLSLVTFCFAFPLFLVALIRLESRASDYGLVTVVALVLMVTAMVLLPRRR